MSHIREKHKPKKLFSRLYTGSHRCRTAHNLSSYKTDYRVWNKEEKLLNLHRQSISNSEATKRIYTDRSTSKYNTKSWETKKSR